MQHTDAVHKPIPTHAPVNNPNAIHYVAENEILKLNKFIVSRN